MTCSYKCVNTFRKPCDIFRLRIQRELRKETEEMDNSQIYPKSWEDVARDKQQELYEHFGDRDWDEFKSSVQDQKCLIQKIGYAVYGLPDEAPSLDNFDLGYSTDKLKHIQDIFKLIMKHDVHRIKLEEGDVLMGIIFVYMKIDIEDCFHIPAPIFRVLKVGKDEGSSNIFIDTSCRVYMGWTDFLKNNTLPDCIYCYPRNGIYYGDVDDKVHVDYGKTPAGQAKSKVLDAVDIGGTVVSVGATVVGLAALAIPVAAPILIASSIGGAVVGAYGAGRSVAKIADMKSHDQSIGLKDPEARSCWLSLGANTAGMIAAGATKAAAVLARNGNVIGKTGQFAINAAQVSSLTINGTNIVNTLFILRDNVKSKSWTYLEVFQFSSSILFFTNTVVSMQTAQTIIRENQQSVLKDFESSLRSNRHRKAYARVAKNTRKGLDAMHGDAKVIKGITNIKNPDDFFSGVVRAQKQYSQNQAEVSFSSCGQVEINNHLIVDPTSFAGINIAERQVILEASKQLSTGVITKQQYESAVNPIFQDHGLFASKNGAIPITSICKAFGTSSLSEVKMGGRSILLNMDGRNIEILVKILMKIMSPKILQLATQLAQKFELEDTAEFLQFLEFCSAFITEILIDLETTYLNALKVARSWANFDQDQFDRDNGIIGDRQQHFINLISQMLSIGRKLTELRERYSDYRRTRTYNNGGESSNHSR